MPPLLMAKCCQIGSDGSVVISASFSQLHLVTKSTRLNNPEMTERPPHRRANSPSNTSGHCARPYLCKHAVRSSQSRDRRNILLRQLVAVLVRPLERVLVLLHRVGLCLTRRACSLPLGRSQDRRKGLRTRLGLAPAQRAC